MRPPPIPVTPAGPARRQALRTLGRWALAWAVAGLRPATAQARRDFPTRSVTLVVPYTAQSGSDILARLLAPRLSALWGQPVVVDNKPGASGNLGAAHVARAPADGHTLLMVINTFAITPALYRNLGYDPVADFAPVAQLAEASLALAVTPALPATDLKGLLALLRAQPGRLNYGSPGQATPQHLAMALFLEQHRVEALHVPYRGMAPALSELGGGQVQLMFATPHALSPLVQAGKARVLGSLGRTRSSLLPQVPTFAEQGVAGPEGVDAWYGVLAPAATPSDRVQQLHRDFTRVLAQEPVAAEARRLGLAVQPAPPAALSHRLQADLRRWRQVVADQKITPE